ncbi:proline racemase family protein [Pseudooceanicola sp. CBS1P-1]|uniref:Hydroxyproline-2-epimerase n=1 Tax=Pseudooceanicola albus TaxID=2692189 RepID=A0A6L7G574_9RHOB|nr:MULTISPECIES: proline racemase family protein [Pseudooceanicola]MBT9386065.1 proline racemase family protein [Pseudooceanicola endophyticus]MXN19514.1 hydroxyproline-2-epimerase [Pseudooceanicola albus]
MHVIDSHTGGEPTRVILDGGPDLGAGPLAERAALLARDHVDFTRSVSLEPRGQVAMVCALLVPPVDPSCVTGVIYFDAGAVLGMCGHGTIGLAVTLAHMGRVGPGAHRIETPAGVVTVEVLDANTVTVTNVESCRLRADVSVEVPGLGTVTGDVAYGGNGFFLVDPSPLPVTPGNLRALTDATIATREALKAAGHGNEVDHVIFYGPSDTPGVHSRNFVLCPDDAYDRSPCGTGSSARLACLAARGRLPAGQEIVQESVIGSSYRLSYAPGPGGGVIPSITGRAYVMAESTLLFDPADPFRNGIPV